MTPEERALVERFGWLPPAVEVARMDARHELAKLRAAAGSEWDKRAVDAKVRAASARDAAVTASHSPAATPDRVPPGRGSRVRQKRNQSGSS